MALSSCTSNELSVEQSGVASNSVDWHASYEMKEDKVGFCPTITESVLACSSCVKKERKIFAALVYAYFSLHSEMIRSENKKIALSLSALILNSGWYIVAIAPYDQHYPGCFDTTPPTTSRI